MRAIKQAVVVALAAAAIALASGCGGGGSTSSTSGGESGGGPPSTPVTIRMGWGIPAEEIKYVMQTYPQVAPNLGKWYKIEWHQFAGTALGVQGLAAGTLDCATVGGLSSANGIDQGADIVLMGEFIEERKPYFSTAWMVQKSSGINTLDDLRGKNVATSAVGGSTDYIQDYWIKKQTGMTPDNGYKKIEIPFGQMQETLLSNRVQMGLFPQPFYGAINATGKVKTMFRITDIINPFVQLLNGCRKSFVDDNQEAMAKFQQDWKKVSNWVLDKANRAKVIKASAKATKIPAKVLKPFLITKNDFYRPKNGAISVGALQNEWNFFHKEGGIKSDHKVTDYLTDISVTDQGGGG